MPLLYRYALLNDDKTPERRIGLVHSDGSQPQQCGQAISCLARMRQQYLAAADFAAGDHVS